MNHFLYVFGNKIGNAFTIHTKHEYALEFNLTWQNNAKKNYLIKWVGLDDESIKNTYHSAKGHTAYLEMLPPTYHYYTCCLTISML